MWHDYDEGRVVYSQNFTNYAVEVFMKDHLGNIRVVYDNTTGQPKQVNAYYPFGLQIATLSSNSPSTNSPNEYLYNGKMAQDELGLNWLDYGARMYDPVVGRFHTLDPLAENFPHQSSFVYAVNNPIKFIDFMGMNADGYTIDEMGKINRVNDTGGKEYDVLYTKKDYNQAINETKSTGEKNEYGNPEPSKSVKVSSGTFSNLITLGDVKGVKIFSESDAMAVYLFAAENFPVEFGQVVGDRQGVMSIVHTSGQADYTETGKVSKYMIDKGYFLTETHHSHPGGLEYGTPSGFYTNGKPTQPATGDAKASKSIDNKNGAPVNHYMYHPFTGNTYRYNSSTYAKVK